MVVTQEHAAAPGRQRAPDLAPGAQVDLYRDGFTAANALELAGSYDVVVDATDNAASRFLASDACAVLNRPLVSGAALGTDGQLTVYCCGPDGALACAHVPLPTVKRKAAPSVQSPLFPSMWRVCCIWPAEMHLQGGSVVRAQQGSDSITGAAQKRAASHWAGLQVTYRAGAAVRHRSGRQRPMSGLPQGQPMGACALGCSLGY